MQCRKNTEQAGITNKQAIKEEGCYHIIITEKGLADGYISVDPL